MGSFHFGRIVKGELARPLVIRGDFASSLMRPPGHWHPTHPCLMATTPDSARFRPMLTALELGQSLNHRGTGGRQMPNHELPQRDPFIGPPTTYAGATVDVVELFADALRE